MPYLFPALITKGLGFAYNPTVPALQDVDITIEPGTICAVVGNSGSGKTTLANLICGLQEATVGTIHFEGKLTTASERRDSGTRHIRLIANAVAPPNNESVAEALRLDGIPKRLGFVDSRELNRRSAGALSMFGLGDVDPTAKYSSLAPGKRKLVEIAAVLSKPTSLLVLDNPTAALTSAEAQILYEQLGKLRFAGAAMLYLTNRAEEALEVGDQVSVLREGRLISTHDPDEVFVSQLEGEMLGRDVRLEPALGFRKCGPEVVLRVEGLIVDHWVFGVCLKVKRGEVLGLLGLEGAGQSQVVRAIAGGLPRQDGDIFLRASAVPSKIVDQASAVANGIELVQQTEVRNLVRSSSSVLMFDSPSRGMSIARRFELYRAIQSLSAHGIGMVVASTDATELARICDRIAVMANGRVVRTFDSSQYSVERMESLLRTGR